MKIYGLLNCTTKEKLTTRVNIITLIPDAQIELPCGVYRFAWDSYCTRLHLECKECNGTGGEEVSGGHKKECEACSGSGIDPVLLEKFEELPIDDDRAHRYWGSAWNLHPLITCKKCLDYWMRWNRSPVGDDQ